MSLKIETTYKGAELTSIKLNEEERLHDGLSYWNRHAPILFPIVGKLKNNQTTINEKIYEMTQHGFARDLDFDVINISENKHEYVLKSNEQTLKKFPFDFELYVTYEIDENKLTVKNKIINKSNQIMYFGLGAHPAFKIDIENQYNCLEFEQEEKDIKFKLLEDGLVSNKEYKNILKEDKIIEINNKTFENDALIFSNIKSDKIFLKVNDQIKLVFDFKEFPYLGIWAKEGAPFVCIEPWFNTADNVNSNGKFAEKENILQLNPKEEFNCKYNVEFF